MTDREMSMRNRTEQLALAGVLAATSLGVLLACAPAACRDCPGGAPGTAISGHSAAWMDRASGEFHGTVVKEAGLDFAKAKWNGIACSACHAGKDASQESPIKTAPTCFACHKGGPDGSPGHPAGFMDMTSPAFHGAVVKAAGYDFKQALSGTLACSTCHAGESPGQASPNSRAPNCFFCHSGGPDGSAAHPVGWGDTAGPRLSDYAGPPSCTACHGTLPSPKPSYRHPAALALDAPDYTGLGLPVTITVTDPEEDRDHGTVDRLAITVKSLAEPAGETVSLVETTAGSGTFVGTVRLERVFGEDGAALEIGSNGKLAVYAEGGVAMDSIDASYGALSKGATYAEPPSTVTGIVKVGGVPRGGSGVQLSGGGSWVRATVSRSDGSYAFHEVPSGTYTVVAAQNGAQQFASTVVVP